MYRNRPSQGEGDVGATFGTDRTTYPPGASIAASPEDGGGVGKVFEHVAGEHDVELAILGGLADDGRIGEVADEALRDALQGRCGLGVVVDGHHLAAVLDEHAGHAAGSRPELEDALALSDQLERRAWALSAVGSTTTQYRFPEGASPMGERRRDGCFAARGGCRQESSVSGPSVRARWRRWQADQPPRIDGRDIRARTEIWPGGPARNEPRRRSVGHQPGGGARGGACTGRRARSPRSGHGSRG